MDNLISKCFLTLTLLTLAIWSSIAATIPSQYSFEKFLYNDKLPSNSVIRIYHDKEGYMWFGTKDGLCRFDGYDIKVFRSSALTPGKLTNNEIQCISEDNEQKLWVGTFEGINIIDKKNYSIKALENKYISKERINSIIYDSKGFVWIGTSNYGVLKMNPSTFQYERYSADGNSKYKIAGNNITNIYEDKDGRIWISSWKKGLCFIDTNKNKIVFSPAIGSDNNPFRLFQDKDGLYWICTWGNGVYNMTLDSTSKINLHPMIISKESETSVDQITYSITQDDKTNKIWIVTFTGLNMIEKLPDGSNKVYDTNSFFDKSAGKLFHEIMKDKRGNLWLGSIGEGLFKLDFNRVSIQNYPLTEIKTVYNAQSYVTRFCQLNSAKVFLVINRLGLFSFNPKTSEVKRPDNQIIRNISSISAITNATFTDEMWLAGEGEQTIHIFKQSGEDQLKEVRELSLRKLTYSNEISINGFFEDSKGNMWIGTNNGLFQKPLNGPIKLISSQGHCINAIAEDKENRIWMGTDKEGLFVFNPIIKNNQIIYSPTNVNLSINNYESFSVQSICCRKNGEVFIGTKEGCIYLYDPHKKIASDISGLYGITDEGIMDIVEDNYGMLWFSTIKRIIKYNPKNHSATYFSNADGMLVTSFFKNAKIILKSGRVLFGGNMGICAFNPALQTPNTEPIKQHVVITDIQIQNNSIFDNELNSHFNASKNKVTLKDYENNLSIEFSALDYSSASKIQYAYQLSGVDKNWNYVGNNRRFVNYANLPSGSYTFIVKASDENGLWSDQITSLEVSILPPFYQTWWAYLSYLALILIITYFLTKNISNRIKLRNELKISHIEKEKSEELAQIKLRYFTNISHELLTPLTIIMLLIERLQSKNDADKTQFDIMKDNIIRLKRLIQQILVFRKTESGNMKLEIHENDIIGFVKNICQSNFNPLIYEKEIQFSIETEPESYMAYFDPDKLDKIIYNLLSNAFKYTHKGGSIIVNIDFTEKSDSTYMKLSVKDSGIGIQEKDIPHIFKRFYISSNSDQSQSHGIGLSLTNDLVQIHKGNIEVKSKVGEGAMFTIEIPISKNMYSDIELSEEEPKVLEFEKMAEIVEENMQENCTKDEHENETKRNFSILIVEDNKELNALITDYFSAEYNVLSAENGLKGLEIIKDNDIDLIISDVMMPEMDGLTFCKLLKNDIATSHINVLMLTAKSSTEDRIDSYNAGADSYIAKPFEMALLEARVKNLISKRKEKTEDFKKNHEITISSMEYGSLDELFLNQAVQIVESRLSDDSFDFDHFAVEMASSKSTLHRKLKSLTGLSPGEFIQNIRLKHAVQMLKNNVGNISEIAFAVGFNDPKYFSRCFKIEFGVTPREFQESIKNE
ncbi:MAG: two-component regulator propeller domain-containing protein [Paludibacter sp.]|nr:two-component regulator propeller domain-containing protein [Paludibacter sp.]